MNQSSKLAALAVGAAAAALVSGASLWPRMSSWGATEAEALGGMPGDELVPLARYRSTHAITIDVRPVDVWPWLVQMGQGRGGLYSYDWLENLLGLHMHSARAVDPALQDLAVGDLVRLVPEGTEPALKFVVARLEAPWVLMLGPDRDRVAAFAAALPYPCWTFELRPVGQDRCRLVIRFQADFTPTLLGRISYKYALQPVHFVMERKMMLGIKQRAEHSAAIATGGTPEAVTA